MSGQPVMSTSCSTSPMEMLTRPWTRLHIDYCGPVAMFSCG